MKYLKLPDGSVFPGPSAETNLIAWALRHTEASPTKEERQYIASVLAAYADLINCSQVTRNKKISWIRSAMRRLGSHAQ